MLSWIPVRKGIKYCAPACGRGCTITEYDKAGIDAKATLDKLRWNGFEIVVHENLGWHWSLSNGLITLHPSYIGDKPYSFFALIKSHDTYLGRSPSRKDPNKAILDCAKLLYDFANAQSNRAKELKDKLALDIRENVI